MLFGDMLQMLILMARFNSSGNTRQLQDPSLKLKVDRMDEIAGSHDLPSTEVFRTAFKTAQAHVLSGTDYGDAALLSKLADRAIKDIEKMKPSVKAVRTSLLNEPQCAAGFLSWNILQIPDEADIQTGPPNRKDPGQCPRAERAFRQRPHLLTLGGSRLSPRSSARAWRGPPTG